MASAWFQKDLPLELARLNSSLGIVDPMPSASRGSSLDQHASATAAAAAEAVQLAAALQRPEQPVRSKQLPARDAAAIGCRQTAEELLEIVAAAAVQSTRRAKALKSRDWGANLAAHFPPWLQLSLGASRLHRLRQNLPQHGAD